MTKIMPKPGMIRESMNKHRRRFVIIEIVLIVLWIWYLCMCQEYIFTVLGGSTPLDEARFSLEVQTLKVGEPFELHRSDDVTIKDYALRSESYWQGDKYDFSLTLNTAEKTPVYFTNATTGTGGDSEGEDVSANIYMADVGGKNVLVMAYPHQELKAGDTVEGIFTEIPLIVAHSIASCSSFDADDEICKYMLDLRGIEMESENFDILFVLVLLAIILLLAVKLVFQFKNFLCTPTFSQLEKYGDPLEVEKMIESELGGAIREKNRIITKNWILSEDTFKLKIVKNHMKHGSFKYTPEAY